MTRNPRLETFLRARYEYETCEPEQRPRCEANLLALAADLTAAYHSTRSREVTIQDLFQITSDAYHEYRRAQLRLQRSRISRTR